MDFKNSKGMVLDGVAASQVIDSSGEVLDIEGADISTLAESGTINVEHMSSDNEKTVPGEETIGRILYAHKILKEDDCESERQKHYWTEVKSPYIYIIYRLYDGAGHRGAQAFAAQIRDAVEHGDKVLVRLSVEGSTLSRDKNDKNRITESVCRKVSATLVPCNRTCDVDVIVDPNAPEGWNKSPAKDSKETEDLLASLIDKKEGQHPNYTRLGGSVETTYVPFDKSETDVLAKFKLIAKSKILKALSAGSYAGTAPGSLVGGSALQVEDRSLRHRMRKAVDSYKPKGPFNKGEFKAMAKTHLPEADDSFMDHFADVAEDYHVKRLKKALDLEEDREVKPQEGLGWSAPPKEKAPPKTKTKAAKPGGQKLEPTAFSPPDVVATAGKLPNPTATAPSAGGGGKKRLTLHPDGMLELPDGQKLTLHIPSGPEYMSILHPDAHDIPDEKKALYKRTVHEPWERAMQNWMELNKKAREGKVPRSIVKLAGLFSAMSPNCLDAETEALTQRGWIKGFDLRHDDILLTKNPKTEALEWQPLLDLRLFPDYEGPLVEIKSRDFCVITTPEHRWLVTTQRGHIKEKTSQTLAYHERIHRTGNYTAPATSGLSPDEAELLGWFVTDGFIRRTNGTKNTRKNPGCFIIQSYQGNPEKCVRINALLLRLGTEGRSGDFSKYNDKGKKCYNWRLGQRLSKMLLARCPDRVLRVEALLDLGQEALYRLREAMILGDGWASEHDGWQAFKTLCTGREEQAGAFQALLTMTGSSSSSRWRDMSKYEPKSPKMKNIPKMTGIYTVSVLHRKFFRFDEKYRREFYAKMPVWCPMVKNTFFVARRRGQVFQTGNTGVPLQERHFGHVMDMLHEGKMDINRPITEEHVQEFARRAQGHEYPKWNREHYEKVGPAPGVSSEEEAIARAGEENKFGNAKGDLPQIGGLRHLDEIMPHLEHLFATHKGDGRKMAEELMNMKTDYKRQTQKLGGAAPAKAALAGKHPIVAGFGPKLTRYMLSMAGAGNIIVPDRHMTRSLYNLGVDDPLSEYLATRVVTQAKNEPFLRSLDQHFYNKHPAVQYVLNKYPEHFKGHEDQAIFPAFWLHWLHIPHYEANQGRATEATIGSTDHKVFWDSVQDSMRHHGVPVRGDYYNYTPPEDTSFDFGENLGKTEQPHSHSHLTMDARALGALSDIQMKHGHNGALVAYFTHVLPALLDAEKGVRRRDPHAVIRKAEEMTINLRKATADMRAAKKATSVYFAGNPVQPGSAHTADGDYSLLHEDDKHYIGVPQDQSPTSSNLVKLPKEKEGTHFSVSKRPAVLISDL